VSSASMRPARPAGADNYLRWRRTIDEHLELRRLTRHEYAMFSWLCTKASPQDGMVRASWPTLAEQTSAKTIYRLAKTDPTLPMLKLGSAVRFPRERLLRWLATREQGHRRTRHPLYSLANSAESRESDRAKPPIGPIMG
jgi:hypothetical protein